MLTLHYNYNDWYTNALKCGTVIWLLGLWNSLTKMTASIIFKSSLCVVGLRPTGSNTSVKNISESQTQSSDYSILVWRVQNDKYASSTVKSTFKLSCILCFVTIRQSTTSMFLTFWVPLTNIQTTIGVVLLLTGRHCCTSTAHSNQHYIIVYYAKGST